MTKPTDLTGAWRTMPSSAIGRRRFLAGAAAFGSLVLLPDQSTAAAKAKPDLLAREGRNPLTGMPAPVLEREGGFAPLTLAAGGSPPIALSSQLATALRASIRGADGADARPLANVLTPGATDRIAFGATRPGTYLLQLAQETRPATGGLALPLVVRASAIGASPADETLMIEEWPAADDSATAPLTANRTRIARIAVPAGGRLRLRLVNACAWRPLAFLLPEMPATVIAIDSAPAEPFAPHGRQLTLAPGGRIDVSLDATGEPGGVLPILLHDGKDVRRIAEIALGKPNNGAAAKMAADNDPATEAGLVNPRLDGALRVDLAVPKSTSGEWRAAPVSADGRTIFSLRAGRTASLALSHPFPVAATFCIEGHHVRLLDRLDDGWKPFWLDTILVPAGETARIAFSASAPGRWRIACTPASAATQPLHAYFEVT